MNEPLNRRALFPVQNPPQSVDETAIAAVAARNGFPEATTLPQQPTPPASKVASVPAAQPLSETKGFKRRRQLTGRDHQFNVRLRRDTLDFIYAVANERNIPIAQVIEEATEALKAKMPSQRG
jgi:hypothetical protein